MDITAMNHEHLRILYKNKQARALFGMKKSWFLRKITFNDLLERSLIKFVDDKVYVLYVILPEPTQIGANSHHLCKVVVESNEFKPCALHAQSQCKKKNLEYARESHMVDYMYNHDRNISVSLGHTEYM